MRRAAKRDGVEPPIVEALLAVGATVLRGDVVDLIVGWRGRNWLLECKTGRGKMQRTQSRLTLLWAGQYAVVRSPDEALRAIGARTA